MSDAEAQSQAPEWEEGDTWAMGVSEDDAEEFSDAFQEAFEELNQPEESEGIDDFDVDADGRMGLYQIHEVVKVEDDGYIMESEIGGGLRLNFNYEGTMKMPAEGEQDMNNIEFVNKTIYFDGDMHISYDSQSTVTYDENFAIEKVNSTLDLETSGSAHIRNFPTIDPNQEIGIDANLTWIHGDYTIDESVDLSTEVQIEFQPALDIFQFPISEGNEWEASSMMDISGEYNGHIDLTEELSGTDYSVADDFPLQIEELDINKDGFEDGEIDLEEEIEIGLSCLGSDYVTLPNEEDTEAHNIEIEDMDIMDVLIPTDEIDEMEELILLKGTLEPPSLDGEIMYSEDEGFVLQQSIDLGEDAEEDIGISELEMKPMDADKAREEKEDIQSTGGGDSIPGFSMPILITSIFFGILIYNYKKGRENW